MATMNEQSASKQGKRRSSYVKKNVPTGRKPEAFVRFQQRKASGGRMGIELSVGRAVWYALDRPDRVAVEWIDKQVRIVPDEGGWKLHIRPNATPRCWVPLDIGVEPGRYKATIEDGVIILGSREAD